MVLAVRHVAEQRLDLLPLPGHVEAGQRHPPRRRRPLADQHAEGAALAGAVGAEQPQHLAAPHLQVEAVHGDEVAVAHHQLLQRQDRAAHRQALLRTGLAEV
jgi:hypothetical protein